MVNDMRHELPNDTEIIFHDDGKPRRRRSHTSGDVLEGIKQLQADAAKAQVLKRREAQLAKRIKAAKQRKGKLMKDAITTAKKASLEFWSLVHSHLDENPGEKVADGRAAVALENPELTSKAGLLFSRKDSEVPGYRLQLHALADAELADDPDLNPSRARARVLAKYPSLGPASYSTDPERRLSAGARFEMSLGHDAAESLRRASKVELTGAEARAMRI